MMSWERITTLPLLPPRPAQGHKGIFGTVIVVGGNALMVGAPAFCATGALRAGTGLVRIAAMPAAGVLPWALLIEPGATGIWLEDKAESAQGTLDRVDPQHKAVVALGPGLGQSDQAQRLVWGLLRQSRPMVLDADGLNLLALTEQPRPLPGPALVMTPHPGEFARLAAPLAIPSRWEREEERVEAAVRLAQAHRAVVVLKGAGTVVTDGSKVYINQTGNPALATAGTGDVLTGCIAGLMAQGLGPLEAGILGAHVHGLAGDLWAKENGPSGLTAADLAALLPQAMQLLRQDEFPQPQT